jgi:hypothetical protein
MFIQLTNANEEFKDQPISIRKDLIVTVYANKEKETTYLYAPPHGTWEVKEKYQDVVDELNEK